MALKRTFENRGKNPVAHCKLKPNGVYAVRHILPHEIADEWGVNNAEQWGVVVLDTSRDVRRTWNMGAKNKWINEVLDSRSLELWVATEKEMQFAQESENAEVMTRRYENEKIRNGILSQRAEKAESSLSYVANNFWHKIANRLDKIFSC